MAWQRSSSSEYRASAKTRSRNHSDHDPEKESLGSSRSSGEYELDEDSPSSDSSRVPSSSFQPMRRKAYSSSGQFSSLRRLPTSIMKWLCLGVAGTLLLFMFTLVKLSWSSDKQVQVAIETKKDAPKPPAWESFPFLRRYYGGVRTLVPYVQNKAEYPSDSDEGTVETTTMANDKRAILDSIRFDPYPNYTSSDYVYKHGPKIDCFLDEAGTVDIPRVRVYEGVPSGFPNNVMGSNAMLGLHHDVCYERFGRLGPYGLGYSLNKGGSGAQQEGEREGADAVWQQIPEVDYRVVKWATAQDRCVAANKNRFRDVTLPKDRPDHRFQDMQVTRLTERNAEPPAPPLASAPTTADGDAQSSQLEKMPRTAVIIRTWRDYNYTPEDLMYLRSIISELSLLSGGEYVVHFLIQVKDDNAPIWSDDATYDEYLRTALPTEFRGMGTLWSERQMGLIYGGLPESWARDLPVHGVYRSTFMPLQYFAHQHPEYDFFWNWEMDIRYTGHWYELFTKVTTWAKAQPRKFLWERNGRFYIPSEHGTWEDFSQMVRFQTEKGTNSANNIWSGLKTGQPDEPGSKVGGDKPIWGPERPLDNVAMDTDAVPPTPFDKDHYTWGVEEEADLITFNPVFDPDGTEWLLAEDTTGYNLEEGQPPRRTAIITASRLSRKLLTTMHRETALSRHTMFSEMWPASCALHHGYKVVYAPHSEYIDRRWPTNYLESVFNGGRNGATGGARTSVWGESRLHNFRGTTWYYNAGFPEVLWHRWLGLKFNNDGGEVFEKKGEGRMCMPAMLLHPVKRVEMIFEHRADQVG